MAYKIAVCGKTDVGLVRDNNEDVWLEVPQRYLYVLADGMGGHRAGEVAAQQAVSTFASLMEKIMAHQPKELPLKKMHEAIQHAIVLVNRVVYEMGSNDPELQGMGTTFCCFHLHSKGLIYANVGDSRIYRLRKKRLEQLTKDHSLLRELVDIGELDESEANQFAHRNIITRAIGTESTVVPAVMDSDLRTGDLILMCSDGLSDHLNLKEIQEILNNHPTVDQVAESLVSAAKEKGGRDNITVVVLKVEEVEDGQDLSG